VISRPFYFLIKLVLNPWNEGMDPDKEIRVFVPPPAAKNAREPHATEFVISAMSQYRWPKAFQAPWGFDLQQTVDLVSLGAVKVLEDIVAYTKELSEDTTELMLRHGFSLMLPYREMGAYS
jgi:hypothetical protein